MKSSTLSSTFAVGALLLLGTGCASLPEPQVAPTGEPLSIDEQTKSYRYTVKEKVGSVSYRDSRGYQSKASVYADRAKVGHYQVWSSYQGNTKISDDDLFAIARDQAGADELKSSRENGVLMNRIGIGLAIVGILAAGTGVYFNSQRSEGDSGTLPLGLIIGGATGFGLGTYLTYAGKRQANAQHPLPQERAQQAADRYNASLTDGPPRQ